METEMSVTSAQYETPYRPRPPLADKGTTVPFNSFFHTAGGPPTDYEKALQALADFTWG